ncbi:putative polygalacturonase [Rosa chinensis]|uniref:Putative polygalacturonase n=1 Tax=Rosa chinensis TaxID=74649 RepID=A0A2P6PJG6_ROSCH|nr:putative polygalacturonase [Rosa chinensis]
MGESQTQTLQIKALLKAWTDACASPKETIFRGHCKAPIELQVRGTLQAPKHTSRVTSPDTWVGFRYINRLTLSGGGTFDGRGALSWKQNDCNENKNCKSRVVNIRFDFVNDTIIKDITSLDSKNFHLNVCHNITFQHATITAPGESVKTDGIHIARSTMFTVANTSIGTGDDCIYIGDGTSQLKFTNVT